MVAPDRFRFDFTHFEQIDADTLDRIERLVNDRVRENIPVQIDEMAAEAAFQSGATALFEEKYGDRVRVISLTDFSKELCGGTHTGRTGNIGLFKIVGEFSIAAGVRRIEALTGDAALHHLQTVNRHLHETARIVRDKPESVPQRIKNILSHQRTVEKEVESLKLKIAALSTDQAADAIHQINGVKVLSQRVAVDSPAALRDLGDRFRDKITSGVIVLGSAAADKALLIAVVTKDLTDRFHAGNIVKAIAPIVGGKGGGRPDMAQAGGSRPDKLDEAIEKVPAVIQEMAG